MLLHDQVIYHHYTFLFKPWRYVRAATDTFFSPLLVLRHSLQRRRITAEDAVMVWLKEEQEYRNLQEVVAIFYWRT